MKTGSFNALEQAGFSPRQSCAIAHAIELECAASHETLATKADLADLRLVTKVDLADLRAEMHAMKSEIIRWLFLVVLGQTAVLAAAGHFYIGFLLR